VRVFSCRLCSSSTRNCRSTVPTSWSNENTEISWHKLRRVRSSRIVDMFTLWSENHTMVGNSVNNAVTAVFATARVKFFCGITIVRSRRQQRSVASTQSGHDDDPWTIRHECWRVYCRRSAGSMNGAGVLAVAANQDQNGAQFLLLRPVIMRGGLACGHRVSPHGRTMNFVSWRWYPEHRKVGRVDNFCGKWWR